MIRNLADLSDVLTSAPPGAAVSDLEEYKSAVVDCFIDCILEKPEKSSTFTTLLGLLNVKQPAVVASIVISLAEKLQGALDAGEFFDVEMLVRFLVDLCNTNVVSAASATELLGTFVDAATAAGDSGVNAGRSDTLVRIVLGTLPWAGQLLAGGKGSATAAADADAASKSEAFGALMDKIETYVTSRSTDHKAMISAVRTTSAEYLEQEEESPRDSLDLLWLQVEDLMQREWKEVFLFRPYTEFVDRLGTATEKHTLPAVTIPEHAGVTFAPTSVPTRVFGPGDTVDGPAMPPHTSIERFLAEMAVQSLIKVHTKNIRECIRRLQMFSQDNARFASMHLIVEAVLDELFRLPTPPQTSMFYHRLLIELVIEIPRFTQVVGLAMNNLFAMAGQLDTEAFARCCSWLANFHNHFDFKFRWAGWDVLLPESVRIKESQRMEAAAASPPPAGAAAAVGTVAAAAAAAAATAVAGAGEEGSGSAAAAAAAAPSTGDGKDDAAAAAEGGAATVVAVAEPIADAEGGGAEAGGKGSGAIAAGEVVPVQLEAGPHLQMVQEVLGRCMRLSYHKQIASSIPPLFSTLIPQAPTFTSVAERLNAATKEAGQFELLSTYVKSKNPDVSELEEILSGVAIPASSSVETDGVDLQDEGDAERNKGCVAAKVFTALVLDEVGVGMVGDFTAAVERHRAGFEIVSSNSRAAKRVIVQTVQSYWAKHPQMAALATSRLFFPQDLRHNRHCRLAVCV